MSTVDAALLPTAPAVDRLWFRTYRHEADLAAIVGLLRAVDEANGQTMVASIDRLRTHYRNMTRVDPREDVVLAFVGDRLVAMSAIEWADTSYGERHFASQGAVHPEWRRQGIGGAMLERNEQRLRAIARSQSFKQTPLLTTWFHDGDIGARELARRRRYRHVRVFHHMVRPTMADVDVATLPSGLEVRPLTRTDLPAYWRALCESYRDHFGSWDDSESSYRAWVESPLFDLELQVVAFDGDEIAGAIHAAIDPHENREHGYLRGWVEPIFTRRRWRRRGLASALIGRTLVLLRDRGMTSAQLHVDAENANQALGLYERHGFRIGSSSSEWHKSLEL